MSERLCNSCRYDCEFRISAEQIAVNVPKMPNLEEQRGIALNAHNRISDLRIEARTQECPQLNEVDPNYFGKELL